MGFFSGILGNAFGSVLSSVGGSLLDKVTGSGSGSSGVGNLIGVGANLASGLLGNKATADANAANLDFAREQFLFNKDYIQNQLQWRIADAKKAGIHPLAAIGIQSPGFSSVSSSVSPLDYSWIGDLGQSANYGATKAKSTPEQKQMVNLQIRGMELDNEYKQAQIDQMKVDTLASTIASDQALSSPPSPKVNQQEPTGLPSAPDKQGYIGEPEVQFNPTAGDPNVFTMNAGNDVTGLWEDKDIAGIIPLDLWPIIKANFIDYASRLRGKIVNGMVYHNARGGWVSVNGPYGKEALADRLGIGRLVRAGRKVINPTNREHFNPHDYAKQFYTY